MHLKSQLHQFVVFLKHQHPNLPDSLLQQFNFGDPTAGSEKAATKPDSEVEPDMEDPAPVEAEDPELEAHNSIENEEEKDSWDDKIEPSRSHPLGEDGSTSLEMRMMMKLRRTHQSQSHIVRAKKK